MKEIRKQVYELTLQDLEETPIWQYALDEEGNEEQDEATVKPRSDMKSASPDKGLFVVKTEFTTNNKSKLYGYCTPVKKYYLGDIQPVIITPKGQVGFWYGMLRPKSDVLEKNYKKLGMNKDSIFPLKFKAQVSHKGTKLKGQIDGFMYLEDFKHRRVNVIR